MSDILAQLRAAIVRGDTLSLGPASIITGSGSRLDRKSQTNFQSRRGRGDPYSVETVYFQHKHSNLPYNDYVKECASERVPHVLLVDKKDLIAYLKGEISECASLTVGKAAAIAADDTVRPATSATNAAESAEVLGPDDKGSTGSCTLDPIYPIAAADRDQRCLDAVLCAENWDFSALRDKLGKHIEAARANGGKANAKSNGGRDNKAFDPRGDRYTATDDRFYRENMGADFFEHGIDPKGSFKKAPTSNSLASPAAATTPSGPKPGTIPPPPPVPASTPRRLAPPTRDAPPAKRSRAEMKTALKDQVPIIIVPSTAGSLLTFHNIKEFLENGSFVAMKEMRARGSMATAATSKIVIRRSPGGNGQSSANYEVVCNPSKLTPSEWNRVVGVVCTGQLWQFKGWRDWEPDSIKKADNGLSDIFRSIRGFVFHFDDTEPPRHTEKWAVKFMPLSRTLRHNDSRVQNAFWDAVDTHCRLHKASLLY
jgi:hypothetical protein